MKRTKQQNAIEPDVRDCHVGKLQQYLAREIITVEEALYSAYDRGKLAGKLDGK